MFPAYLNDATVLVALWPIVLGSTTVALIASVVFAPTIEGERRRWVELGLFQTSLSFALLGMVSGYIMALSRAPAVGTVLPAILSLIGGLGVFLMSRESSSRVLINVTIATLAVSLLVGGVWGSIQRVSNEALRNSLEAQMDQLDDERILRCYRKKLQLESKDDVYTGSCKLEK